MALTQISTDGIKNGTITNADLASDAAIAGTKISPNFGSQDITTTGPISGKDLILTDTSPAITFTDTNNNPDFRILVQSGDLQVYDITNGAYRFTVNSSGNVGIGTTSPDGKLSVTGNIVCNSGVVRSNDGFVSDTDLILNADANDNGSNSIIFKEGTTERARFKTDGDLLLTRQTAGGGNETLLITANFGSGSDQALQASNSLRFYTNGANERLRIASNGRIGKGTTSPTTDFDVIRTNSSLTDVMLVKGNTANAFIRFQDNDSSCNFTLGADAGSGTGDNSFVLYDRVNSAYRWSIDNSGNMKVWSGNVEVSTGKVGIGTSNPSAKLQVHNTGTPDSQLLRLVNTQHDTNAGSSAQLKFGITNSVGERNARIEAKETTGNTNDVALDFYTNTANSIDGETIKMRIAAAGNVGIGTTSPGDYDSSSDNLVVKGAENTGITIATAHTGRNTSLVFSDGTGDSDSKFRGAVQYLHNGDIMRFLTASGERMRITSGGTIISTITSPDPFNTIQENIELVNGAGNSGAGSRIKFTCGSSQAHIQSQIISGNSTNGTSLVFATSDSTSAAVQCMVLSTAGHVTLGRDYSNNPSNVLTGVTTVRGHCVNTGTTDNDFAQLYLKNSSSSGNSSASIRGYREDSNYNTGLRFYTHNHPSQGGDGSERMRIDSTGRVLIGTTENVVSKLYVSGGSFSLTGSDSNFGGGGNRVFLDHDNNDVRFGFTGGGGSNTTKGIRFYHVNNHNGTTNNNRITQFGEFRMCHGAGSDSAVSTDFVNGIGDTSLDTIQSNLARLVMQERTGNWISFKTGGGTHFGTIARSGSGVSYGSNSDYRLKDNVANLTGGIALVKQLRPVTFNWNDLSGLSKTETHQGFIAHEVQALVPDAVDGEKDGMDVWGDCTDSEGNVTQTNVPESKKKDGETWTKKGEDIHDQQLDTGKLIPILTAAIKSLISKVEVLETEVAGLKAA